MDKKLAFAEMDKQFQKQLEEARKYREATDTECDQMDGFNVLELGHWITLCKAAGVPYVPAENVATASKQSLMNAIDGEVDESAAAFWTAVEAFKERVGKGFMLRWSCCSCAEVKSRLGNGEPEWHSDLMKYFMLDDIRASDLVYDYPGKNVSAWGRPWVQFYVLDGYPVEYRAFVEENALIGISNYYPQRPLPDNAETQEDIGSVTRHVMSMIAKQNKPIICPQAPSIHKGESNWWTADFARLPSGAIVFLEGGPAHFPGGGAHCCCFPPGEIDGVALEAVWKYY